MRLHLEGFFWQTTGFLRGIRTPGRNERTRRQHRSRVRGCEAPRQCGCPHSADDYAWFTGLLAYLEQTQG